MEKSQRSAGDTMPWTGIPRWDRTEKAYLLYTQAQGVIEKDPVSAVKNAYEKGQTDEFAQPIIIADENNAPLDGGSGQ